jgi:hypothetical protein
MGDPDEMKIYPCPLPGCQFAMVSEPPGPAENNRALADVFGFGVFGAIATAHRLERMERELTCHLNTHGVQEFAIALAKANKRIAELTVPGFQEASHG